MLKKNIVQISGFSVQGKKMASNSAPNFDSMKVSELKQFLKDSGASSSGNKPDLVKRAKLYHSRPEETVNPSTSSNEISEELKIYEEKRKIFHSDHEYHDLEQGSSVSIPDAFDSDTICQYLTNWRLYDKDNDEEVDISTRKPAKKGEKMYNDKMIQFVQFSEDDVLDLLIFRGNINASMAQEVQ